MKADTPKESKMKGYGLSRNDDVENPDVQDIREYGLNTSTGGKCYQKPESKASSRRIWKKKERKNAKEYCRNYLK